MKEENCDDEQLSASIKWQSKMFFTVRKGEIRIGLDYYSRPIIISPFSQYMAALVGKKTKYYHDTSSCEDAADTLTVRFMLDFQEESK